jgi:hypothetical protein
METARDYGISSTLKLIKNLQDLGRGTKNVYATIGQQLNIRNVRFVIGVHRVAISALWDAFK